jgi:DNA-binding transcriptional MerR regulator
MTVEYYYRRQVTELFECDEEFLNLLEAEELVHSTEMPPSGERVFSPDQVERIRVIRNLIREMEVNLPGCEIILEMRENMIRMQEQFDRVLGMLLAALKQG